MMKFDDDLGGGAPVPASARKIWKAPRLERAGVAERTNKKDRTPTDGIVKNIRSISS